MKQHLEDLVPRCAAVPMAVCSAAEASLAQHGEMQCAAGLGKHGPGIVMGHVADIIVVDLKNLVSGKEPSISGNDPIPVDFLDDDVDQWCLIAAHDADS